MAVRTGGAYTGAVGVVNGGGQLLEGVGLHFVTANAKRLGIGELHGRVETTPENNAGNKATHRYQPQTQVRGGAVEGAPIAFNEIPDTHSGAASLFAELYGLFEHLVNTLEGADFCRACVRLGYMAFHTEVTPW